jgi:fucokinase
MGVVALGGGEELGAQLDAFCGAPGVGLEIETWSLVPLGSGLGTSSILAGVVLAALGGALGRAYSREALNHLVLIVEQMLTTGGGWQDQVGGLWPGLKTSWCAAELPVTVRVMPLDGGGGDDADDAAMVPRALVDRLNAHLFLLYTGRTRLAKHLLQRVLRQWAVRENGITQTVEDLRNTAAAMAAALRAGDLPAAGARLNEYWEQKKKMAPLAEPAEVREMLEALRSGGLILGASLCGAGGGGFLVGIAAEAGAGAPGGKLEQALRAAQGGGFAAKLDAGEIRFHECRIDEQGLRTRMVE